MSEANVIAIKKALKDKPMRTSILREYLEKKYSVFPELPYLLKVMEDEGAIKYDGVYWSLTETQP